MVIRILATSVVALCLLAPATAAQEQKGVGSKPPKLADVEWLRGRPLKQFKRGTTYVLYFWATTARNCGRTVPLLEEARDKHKKKRVELIGINIWSRSGLMPAETFLEKREGFMDFPIARDTNGATAKTWDKLVGLRSVPRVVIIDNNGLIAWSGHPFDGVDVALEAILARDEEALSALVAERTELHETANELAETISKSWKYKWWHKAPGQIDELIELDRRMFGTWAGRKYEALVMGGKHELAADYGRESLGEKLVSCEAMLNEIAWFIVDPKGEVEDDARDVELALRTARWANELSGGRDSSVLDTLARAHYASGDVQGAAAYQQQAVKEAFSSEERDALEKTLREYESDEQASDAD
jgi:hypothetical protein